VILTLAGPTANWPWVEALLQKTQTTHRAFLLQDLTLPEERIEPFPAQDFIGATVSPRTIVGLVAEELL
jgi:hypothetical protein